MSHTIGLPSHYNINYGIPEFAKNGKGVCGDSPIRTVERKSNAALMHRNAGGCVYNTSYFFVSVFF